MKDAWVEHRSRTVARNVWVEVADAVLVIGGLGVVIKQLQAELIREQLIVAR